MFLRQTDTKQVTWVSSWGSPRRHFGFWFNCLRQRNDQLFNDETTPLKTAKSAGSQGRLTYARKVKLGKTCTSASDLSSHISNFWVSMNDLCLYVNGKISWDIKKYSFELFLALRGVAIDKVQPHSPGRTHTHTASGVWGEVWAYCSHEVLLQSSEKQGEKPQDFRPKVNLRMCGIDQVQPPSAVVKISNKVCSTCTHLRWQHEQCRLLRFPQGLRIHTYLARQVLQ